MHYTSTRGGFSVKSSALAVKMGIAPDGGLFVPQRVAKASIKDISRLMEMSYPERALKILSCFLTDYSRDELLDCVNKAYNSNNFDTDKIAPVIHLTRQLSILELWHGPTSAFKDMALQILPHILVKAMDKTGEEDEIVILVATSGDTGKAALEGFKDIPGTRIIVFYPLEGVSEIQKRQMITQEGSNVHVVGVEGNFDDTQNGVKKIFTDEDIINRMQEKGLKFSSANSINWGRLAPQIVYYFSAYCDLVIQNEIKLGDNINIVVPTGNFGNILAAYYALIMGLPVNRLICASNENNVLTEFINTGIYNRNRIFKKTMSPSMDILISSNLERLLFEITGHDSEKVSGWVNKLAKDGIYTADNKTLKKISEIFWAEYTSEEETVNTIRGVYKDYGYLVDTHTAVGIDVYDKYVITTGDMTKSIVASTASPYKFNRSVAGAIIEDELLIDRSEFEILDILSGKTMNKVPEGLKNLDKKHVLHNDSCEPSGMKGYIENILGI